MRKRAWTLTVTEIATSNNHRILRIEMFESRSMNSYKTKRLSQRRIYTFEGTSFRLART